MLQNKKNHILYTVYILYTANVVCVDAVWHTTKVIKSAYLDVPIFMARPDLYHIHIFQRITLSRPEFNQLCLI